MSEEVAVASPGFEGPEKNLEVDFVPNQGPKNGLRELNKSDWDDILDLAKCQILNTTSNEYFDAYVLSESSLFVYKFKCVIKTCGTTTLLRCLSLLLEKARAIGMELEWIGYSRKNYTFPDHQVYPHTSFSQEVQFAKNCMDPKGKPISGGAHVLGDLTSDHWYLYVADYCERAIEPENAESNINIMMYGIDEEVAKIFYRDPNPDSISPVDDAKRATIKSGIDTLVDGATIDDYMFEPCGYSMNALLLDSFFTIHITPEKDFSYASFETNLKSNEYRSLVRNVLRVFRPSRFTITIFADEDALDGMESLPSGDAFLPVKAENSGNVSNLGYHKVSNSMTRFKTDYVCHMANFIKSDGSRSRRSSASSVAVDTSVTEEYDSTENASDNVATYLNKVHLGGSEEKLSCKKKIQI